MIIIQKQKKITPYNKHQEYLSKLPKIPQNIQDIQILYSPKEFKKTLIHTIKNATNHIYITTLYFETDQAGKEILNTLFEIKKNKKTLKIIIIVDWHRAQRKKIGEYHDNNTNINWYHYITEKHPNTHIPIYGIPINFQEALGVLHLKGFIIDNKVIYSGANINNVYLHQKHTYRYDRYHVIYNQTLANTMINYIHTCILNTKAIQQLNLINQKKNKNKTQYDSIISKIFKKI